MVPIEPQKELVFPKQDRIFQMCDCLSGDPIAGDPRNFYQNEWHTGMCNAPCASPGCFLIACVCPCPTAYVVRERVLGGNWNYYKCCQGYYDCACWKAGMLGESSCPQLCNMLEAYFCFGCQISSSRALVMDTRSIRPDPCDNRLVGLNNFLVILSCICDILAMFIEELEPLSHLLDLISELVTKIVSSCMLTQVNLEVTSAPRPINWDNANMYPRGACKAAANLRNCGGAPGIPQQQYMGGPQGYGGPPPPAYGAPPQGGYGGQQPAYGGYPGGQQPGYGRGY